VYTGNRIKGSNPLVSADYQWWCVWLQITAKQHSIFFAECIKMLKKACLAG